MRTAIKPAFWVLLVVAACGLPDRDPKWRPAGASAPRTGGTLRFAIGSPIATLDPTIAYDEFSFYALHLLFDTLIDYEPGGVGLVPRLAERWELSDDRLTYRFWLRPGITYSDGKPIVAADFKYSLERALRTPDSPFGPMLADVVGATELTEGKTKDCAGIRVASERELVIQLARPYAAFLYLMAMKFATPQRTDHVAAAGDQLRRQPLGSGPFVLEQWSEGERLVVTRNPSYFDPGRGRLDRIVMLENISRDMQLLMFERGEIDTAERLASPDAIWLTSQPAWRPYVHTRLLMNCYAARMDVEAKPFDDLRVRQALNYAVDKRSPAKLLAGAAVAAHGALPPGVLGRDDAIAPYPYDPARARGLLAQAGLGGGFDLDYYVIGPDEDSEMVAAALQGDLARVGVHVRIHPLAPPTFMAATSGPQAVRFAQVGWLGDFPDPTTFLDLLFHSRMIGVLNGSRYKNPELDSLLDQARSEIDAAKRTAMYQRAERILYDDAPWIWNYHWQMTEVTQPYVRGYQPHPIWVRDYTAAWLDLGPDGNPVPR